MTTTDKIARLVVLHSHLIQISNSLRAVEKEICGIQNKEPSTPIADSATILAKNISVMLQEISTAVPNA